MISALGVSVLIKALEVSFLIIAIGLYAGRSHSHFFAPHAEIAATGLKRSARKRIVSIRAAADVLTTLILGGASRKRHTHPAPVSLNASHTSTASGHIQILVAVLFRHVPAFRKCLAHPCVSNRTRSASISVAALHTITAISVLGHAEITSHRSLQHCASLLALSVSTARQVATAFGIIIASFVCVSTILVLLAISLLSAIHLHTVETFIARKIVAAGTVFPFL
jgi:hypothetical protein